jgi:ribosomal protein S27AE
MLVGARSRGFGSLPGGCVMLGSYCPGSASLRNNISLEIKTCPECGADVELFSIDRKVACDKCGFVVYNNALSCIQWCRYAEQCFGAEMVTKYKKPQ